MIPPSAQRLIRSLEQPAVLGEEVEEVRTLTTHMSWVLLAGPYAYKIKKPVDLGFADFATLERRRYFCDEELRVNRRLAPELYLDVATIYGTAEAPTLETVGEPIEYAVKMRRFPQEARLDRVLASNQFRHEHLDGLIRQIAEFHARVEVDVDGRGFGTPEAVRKPMEANFEHLADDVKDRDVLNRIERLQQWSVEHGEARREDFARRKQDGFIRECHGDMHLGNMFLQDESVVIAETTRRCYSRLAELAEAVVRAGFTVVVDAAFLDRRQRDKLSHTAAKLSVPFRIVHFRADEPTLRRRLCRREAGGGDASEADLAVLRHQLESCQPLREEERRASLDIDTAEANWQEKLITAVQAWRDDQ